MRGCVMGRGKTYTVIVYLGRDPETGKKRRKWHGGYRTKKEAERACAELVRDLGRGSYVEPNPITVGEYLTKWLANHRQNLKPSTVPSYEIAVEKHLIPRIGAMPLQKLAPHHLDTMYGELRTNGHRQRPGGLSARSVRAIHGVMRRALNQAVKAGLLETNPALRATPPQAKSARTDARQSRAVPDLGGDAEVPGERAGARFAGGVPAVGHDWDAAGRGDGPALARRRPGQRTGRRSSRRCLHRATSSRSPGRRARTGWRTVDLDEGTVAVLRAHRKRLSEERLAFGPGRRACGAAVPRPGVPQRGRHAPAPGAVQPGAGVGGEGGGPGYGEARGTCATPMWRCWERRASTRRWCRSGWATPTLASPCGSTARCSRSSTGRRRIGWASCSPLTAPRPRVGAAT